jgi:hypothetical protein
MAVSIVIAPIAPDRVEDWHAFHAVLTGPRRGEWAESQRRRGVTREAVFFWESPSGPAAVYLFEGVGADDALDRLRAGEHQFDDWLRTRMAALHSSLDVPQRVFDTRPAAGAWRGWRNLFRGGGVR